MDTRPPAVRPCGSCPYRRDVPSGVWTADEYAKLPGYDLPTGEQPTALFMCHQADGRVCAGWAGCHDMDESLALRFARFFGVPDATVQAIYEYVSAVPLWPTGAAAAAHGIAQVNAPPPAAKALIDKVARRRAARHDQGD